MRVAGVAGGAGRLVAEVVDGSVLRAGSAVRCVAFAGWGCAGSGVGVEPPGRPGSVPAGCPVAGVVGSGSADPPAAGSAGVPGVASSVGSLSTGVTATGLSLDGSPADGSPADGSPTGGSPAGGLSPDGLSRIGSDGVGVAGPPLPGPSVPGCGWAGGGAVATGAGVARRGVPLSGAIGVSVGVGVGADVDGVLGSSTDALTVPGDAEPAGAGGCSTVGADVAGGAVSGPPRRTAPATPRSRERAASWVVATASEVRTTARAGDEPPVARPVTGRERRAVDPLVPRTVRCTA